MNPTPLPQGLTPVMLMPFTANDRIDFEGLDTLTEFYLRAGATGLFANCLSTEMFHLSPAERLAHTRRVVDVAGGRVPVVASGTFGGSLTEQATFIKKMHDTGVDAVIVVTNQLAAAAEPDAVFLARLLDLLRLTPGVPLGLYECPVPYKRLVTPAVLSELIGTGRVLYHKDTSCSVPDVAAKLAVLNGQDFGFYDAHVPNALASLRLGARGLSAIAGNYFPEILVWLCDHFDDPDQQETVEWLQLELTRTNALLHVEYPMSAKYFLQRRGLPIGLHSRVHPSAPTPEQAQALDELAETMQHWQTVLQSTPVLLP